MSPTIYYILHVTAVLVMTGYTFYAFAAGPETRKRVMMITGIASVIALIAGFGLQAKLNYGFPGWLIVKLLCWLGLSALAGFGYRRRGAAGALAAVTLVLAFIAVVMVYTRPF
jgi:multisubunit Na+/H+ antiporter MnhF subunit